MHKYRAIAFIVFFIVFSIEGFSQKPLAILGKWKGAFPINNGQEIPFNFEISASIKHDTILHFINGNEKYLGGKVKTINDTVFISLDQFDNELALGINNDQSLTGYWRKQNRAGESFPVNVYKNKTRFNSINQLPSTTIGSKYAVEFTNDKGKKVKSVGLFKQEGNKLFATFLRVSGDTRYTEGIIEGNQFKLSMFIGAGPVLFTGTINADGSLQGEQVGLKSVQTFTAFKNDTAQLPNASAFTLLKSNEAFNFSFRNAAGKIISLTDERYKNKPVIVTIGGTWCPNCADEAIFLSKWYKSNHQRGIEIVTIQFELMDDFKYAQKTMQRFKEKFNIPYEMVFGGMSDNAKVLEALPALEKFYGFPTTLFLDKNKKVVKIHTGFSGPATGKFYTDFIDEFNASVNTLLQ
jgi:thiol-disulfide isomerase/thioredoxin